MSQPRTAQFYHATFDAVIACLVVLAAVATMIAVQLVLVYAGAIGATAVAISELVMVAVPIVLVRRARLPVAAIGLARPRARFIVAALLVGVSLWYANLRLHEWLRPPVSPQLVHLVERDALAVALAAVALVPAVCEEIVFRGVLARSLARRLPLVAAVAISAIVFSAYHMSLAQLAPTLTLGLAFGVIAVRADSAIPTMIGHAANNTIAILLSRGELGRPARWIFENPDAALAASLVLAIGGVALALPRSA
jgi:membrane protease YdiL (CAAX protease family)